MLKGLDEEYLGQKYPGPEWVRGILLEDLEEWLNDPAKGPKWVWENRRRLLAEAALLVKEWAVLRPLALKS